MGKRQKVIHFFQLKKNILYISMLVLIWHYLQYSDKHEIKSSVKHSPENYYLSNKKYFHKNQPSYYLVPVVRKIIA